MLETSPGRRHLCITAANVIQVIGPVLEATPSADQGTGRSSAERSVHQHAGARVGAEAAPQRAPRGDSSNLSVLGGTGVGAHRRDEGKAQAGSVALLLEGDDEQDAELASMLDELDRQMR